jgi:hypothetical protein
MIKNFPNYWDSPSNLLQLDGSCGLITAWGILRYFGKRTSSERLIESCCYTKKHGIFTIALAIALREHGLSVKYFSKPDPNPNAIEKRCYRNAEKVGVQINAAVSLESLLAQITANCIPIVSYNTAENSGHLTPLLGAENGKVILPYSDEGSMPKREFLSRWSAPEIFRQCIVACL